MTYSQAKSCIQDLGRDGLESLIKTLDEDIITAGLKAGISPDNIEEAYQGQYDSDTVFAQELADDLGSIDKNAAWPMNCIDWEYAARELMHDYCEQDGYYFRNL